MLNSLLPLAIAACLQSTPPAHEPAAPDAPPPASAQAATQGADSSAAEAKRAVDAARAFLDSLGADDRAKVKRPFEDHSRREWSYLPGDRPGLFLSSLTPEQRALALALATSSLSADGRERVRLIRETEDLRRADDARRGAASNYGGDLYALLIFGEPGEGPWGWRLEGHHLGLHFSSLSGETATTPLFFGAFPVVLADGPDKGKRPLGALQDAALELRRSLTPEQVKAATVGEGSPADVITGPQHEAALRDPTAQGGIAMTDLAQTQRDLLWGLLLRHVLDLRGDLASDELRRIKSAGTERIRFGWAGEPQLDKPHYYRIAGPSFVIEFDCTQGNPNHVHCVWNDPERNFGDALAAHLRAEHRAAD
ncbi:MAG: DUF3500 domain-containing protein [Phycisphaerales bacterium]